MTAVGGAVATWRLLAHKLAEVREIIAAAGGELRHLSPHGTGLRPIE
jgi:hypothetical protein